MTYAFEESRFSSCLCFLCLLFIVCSLSQFKDSYWEDSVALVKASCLSLLASYGYGYLSIQGLYAVFFILCTTTIDFISLSCDLCEVLLKKISLYLSSVSDYPVCCLYFAGDKCMWQVHFCNNFIIFFSAWVHYI